MRSTGLSLLAAVALAGPAAAQSRQTSQVPATVQRAFLTKFPGIHAAAWTVATDRTYVAEFTHTSADVKATFRPSGEWVETATEIGAITLPEAVRTAIVGGYRGYRFAETRRLDRPTTPEQLFEVELEKPGQMLTLQFNANGTLFGTRTVAPPAGPILSATGTWRGESVCRNAQPACRDESVIYHIVPAVTDTAGFDVQMNRVVDGREVPVDKLACTLDRGRAALYCIEPHGIWHFQLSRDSLVGGLALQDGTAVRHIAVRRQR